MLVTVERTRVILSVTPNDEVLHSIHFDWRLETDL